MGKFLVPEFTLTFPLFKDYWESINTVDIYRAISHTVCSKQVVVLCSELRAKSEGIDRCAA